MLGWIDGNALKFFRARYVSAMGHLTVTVLSAPGTSVRLGYGRQVDIGIEHHRHGCGDRKDLAAATLALQLS